MNERSGGSFARDSIMHLSHIAIESASHDQLMQNNGMKSLAIKKEVDTDRLSRGQAARPTRFGLRAHAVNKATNKEITAYTMMLTNIKWSALCLYSILNLFGSFAHLISVVCFAGIVPNAAC